MPTENELVVGRPTGSAPVPPDAAEGPVHTWEGNGYELFGYTAAGSHWLHVPGVATFRFNEGERTRAFPERGARRADIHDIYLRGILPLVVQAAGTEVLHASAVAGPGGIIALCGRSRAGKSTLAHALALRGYAIWADDALAFEIAGREPVAVGLPFGLRLRPDARTFLEATDSRASTDSRSDPSAPLRLILELRRDPESEAGVETSRLRPADAFVALLPHAYCFSLADERHNRRMLGRYLELSETVPLYSVAFAGGFRSIESVLDHIEDLIEVHAR